MRLLCLRSGRHAVEVTLKGNQWRWTEVCGTVRGQHEVRRVYKNVATACPTPLTLCVSQFDWLQVFASVRLRCHLRHTSARSKYIPPTLHCISFLFVAYWLKTEKLEKCTRGRNWISIQFILVVQIPPTHGPSGSVCWMFPPGGGS